MNPFSGNRSFLCCLSTSFLVITIGFLSPAQSQEVFSIDIGSGAPFAPGDVLVPGPGLAIGDTALAAGGVLTGVEIDGISDGNDFGTDLLFSVDRPSTGAVGTDVFTEFVGGGLGPFDHTADIYYNPLVSITNFIFRDGDGIANPLSAPSFGLAEPFPAASDNVDAYDFGAIGGIAYGGPVYFTVGAAASGGFATEDIHFVPTPGGVVSTYVSGATMSLTAGDDIDAIFVLDDGDMIFSSGADVIGFSLDRADPSLTAGSTLSLLYAGGAALSPADVFILTGTGGAFYVPASSHGLLFTDNIDALDQTFVVPEPGTTSVICLAAIGLFIRRRRRKS